MQEIGQLERIFLKMEEENNTPNVKSVSRELRKLLEKYTKSCNDRKIICEGVNASKELEEAKLYANNELSSEQKRQIQKGFKEGLTLEQVKLYATDATKSSEVMRLFRVAFKEGLTFENVEFMSKYTNIYVVTFILQSFLNGFNKKQILFILRKLGNEHLRHIIDIREKKKISFEDIKVCIEKDYNPVVMYQIICAFHRGLTKRQFDLFANFFELMISKKFSFQCLKSQKRSIFDFGELELREMLEGFMEGRTIKEVCLYADPSYQYWQMRGIRKVEGKITYEQAKFALNKKFNFYQSLEIMRAFSGGLSFDQVEIFSKPEFGFESMRTIKYFFYSDYNLLLSKVKALAKPEYSQLQIEFMGKGFEKGLTYKQVELYTKVEGNDRNQLEEIEKGFENGLTYEQVKLYTRPQWSFRQMRRIREEFEAGITVDQIQTF